MVYFTSLSNFIHIKNWISASGAQTSNPYSHTDYVKTARVNYVKETPKFVLGPPVTKKKTIDFAVKSSFDWLIVLTVYMQTVQHLFIDLCPADIWRLIKCEHNETVDIVCYCENVIVTYFTGLFYCLITFQDKSLC